MVRVSARFELARVRVIGSQLYDGNSSQLSFLEFDVNVFEASLSFQRYFNPTEYREVIVRNSLLITHAGMQI